MRSSILLTLVLFLLSEGVSAQPSAPGGTPLFRAELSTPAPVATAATLEGLGYDVGATSANTVELFVSPADLLALQSAGFSLAILEPAQPLAAKLATAEGGGAPTLPVGYHDLAGLNGALTAAQTAHPGIALVVDVAAVYGPGSTFGGRPINVLKISDNVAQDEDEPSVLFVGAHHAREIVPPEVCLELINTLLSGYGSDPAITALIDGNEIWIAPTWNPDGLDHVWNVNNLWRKNRKPENTDFGVDQNRNYLMGWDSSCGGSTNPASNTYRGLLAGSEEETLTMLAFARDRRFAKVIDHHSHGQEVLLTYTCSPMPTAVESFIDGEAAVLATAAGYTTREPSAEGEHQQWQTMENTSFAFLVETATSFQPAFVDALTEASILWPLHLAVLQRDIPIMGHVSETGTGLPLVADVSVTGVNWQNGETRNSEARFGRYHLWLPPGSFDVTFSAAGYLAQTITVALPATGTLVLDVNLQPAPPAFTLTLATAGGGVGDLQLGIQNIPPATQQGYVLISFLTTSPAGQGPLAGIWPDSTTLALLTQPPAAGNPLHWTWPVGVPLFPALDLAVPPGGIPFVPGTEMDGVAVALGLQYSLLGLSDVIRVVF